MKLRLLLMITFTAFTTLAAQTKTHNFSVKDDIEMAHFSDPSDAQENFDTNHVKYSPDGQRVAIVTTRGLLQTDKLESTLFVFNMSDIRASLHDPAQPMPNPRPIAVVTSRPSGLHLSPSAPQIEDIRWSSDSKNLYFKAMNSVGAAILEEVSADGVNRRQLTPSNYSVGQYDLEDGTIAYTASKLNQPPPPLGDPINRDATAVTGHRIQDILFPSQLPSYPQVLVLGTVQQGDDNKTVHKIRGYVATDALAQLFLFPFRLSPNGRQLIATMPLLNIPASWAKYDPEVNYAAFRFDPKNPLLTKPENAALRPREYVLIDLGTGKVKPLINGPNGFSLAYTRDLNVASWSPDGTRVLVTNVFFPLSPSGTLPSTEPCRVASVDLPSMYARCLFFRDDRSSPSVAHIDAVHFEGKADEVEVSMQSSPTDLFVRKFHLERDNWESEGTEIENPNGFAPIASRPTDQVQMSKVEVYVKQSLNVRPTLWATDKGTGESRQIWDPNPQLEQIRFGDVSEYHWKDLTGNDWIGGLVKPVDYIPGKRYPLILQMYTFRQDEFLTDGTDPTAFAAREFASNGFVVLQMRKKPSVVSETYPQMHLQAYRSAVQSLSDAGLIDPEKVGVVGFSMTCWLAEYALVHAPHLFAAATIADGFDYNYMQYMLLGPGFPRLIESVNQVRDGDFWGPAKEEWFKDELGFHLDQVKIPVRIEAITPVSVLSEWELYSSENMQHKPVDLIYFPEGSHVHQRPLERYESQQGDIDWMRFWLQDYEDPDPEKRPQYQRWEAMKTHSQATSGDVGHPRE